MAVSKRLRYEILRRDRFACRYCGATAPDTPLRVDHITPIALGGGDEPTNLVTSCEPCNAGKSSTLPDPAIAASVVDAQRRWSEARADPISCAWADSYVDRFGAEPPEKLIAIVKDAADAGRDLDANPEEMRRAAIAAGACGAPHFGLFLPTAADELQRMDEVYRVWRECWRKAGHDLPTGFEIDRFQRTASEAIALEHAQYHMVQYAARTGAAGRCDLLETLESAGVRTGGDR